MKDYPWKDTDMVWAQWPKDRLKPTLEEFKQAEKRYRDEIVENDKELAEEGKFDFSDWRSGLNWVMSTYCRPVWWPYFFPNEEIEVWNGFLEATFFSKFDEDEQLVSRYKNGF
jgi:hypothetical protein